MANRVYCIIHEHMVEAVRLSLRVSPADEMFHPVFGDNPHAVHTHYGDDGNGEEFDDALLKPNLCYGPFATCPPPPSLTVGQWQAIFSREEEETSWRISQNK